MPGSRGTPFFKEGDRMKRIMILIMALLAVMLWSTAAAEEAPADAVAMSRRMGNGINLGNTMEACNNGKNGGFTQDIPTYYEMYWGQPLTKPDMLQAMKDCGT